MNIDANNESSQNPGFIDIKERSDHTFTAESPPAVASLPPLGCMSIEYIAFLDNEDTVLDCTSVEPGSKDLGLGELK